MKSIKAIYHSVLHVMSHYAICDQDGVQWLCDQDGGEITTGTPCYKADPERRFKNIENYLECRFENIKKYLECRFKNIENTIIIISLTVALLMTVEKCGYQSSGAGAFLSSVRTNTSYFRVARYCVSIIIKTRQQPASGWREALETRKGVIQRNYVPWRAIEMRGNRRSLKTGNTTQDPLFSKSSKKFKKIVQKRVPETCSIKA